MKVKSKPKAQLTERSRKLSSKARGVTARGTLQGLAAAVARCLRLSAAQVRGGRKLVKRDGVWYVPLWLPIAIVVLAASSALWDDAARIAQRLASATAHPIDEPSEFQLAPFFAPPVRYWSAEIEQWAAQSDVDPHLLATVMQIESCGHPRVISGAGAQGLFQVMPFHFVAGEDMREPQTNARRGADYLNYCAGKSDGVVGLTLACYNGGPSVISRARESWPLETQRYYRWGVGIYSDAIAGAADSETYDQWLAAGGARLCANAIVELIDELRRE